MLSLFIMIGSIIIHLHGNETKIVTFLPSLLSEYPEELHALMVKILITCYLL